MNKGNHYIRFSVDGKRVKWDTSRRLLTPGHGNVKLLKSEKAKLGYSTMGLHLSPANTSGYNVCPKASKGCKAGCLNYSGQGQMFREGERYNSRLHVARIAKTRLFVEQRGLFFAKLKHEIGLFIKRCEKKGTLPAIRLNCTSDIAWERVKDPETGKTICELYPNVQFYDYTKIHNRLGKTPSNYYLNFSRTENNFKSVLSALNMGINVCVVFEKDLPGYFHGSKVVNGDLTDLRFLDKEYFDIDDKDESIVIGLKAKGWRSKQDKSGFVIRPDYFEFVHSGRMVA